MLDSDEGILDGACSDQFIQLHLDGCAVPVLRVLDQETIRNVTMVVPVLMTSCQVSENRNRGPVTAQMTITVKAKIKADARPASCNALFAISARLKRTRNRACPSYVRIL